MRVLDITDKDLQKWKSLTDEFSNCVVSGDPLFKATPELNNRTDALVLVTKPSADCYRFIRAHSAVDVHDMQFVQFRTFKVCMGGFGGKRLWLTQILIGKDKTNPGLRLKTAGFMRADTLRLTVGRIEHVMKGQGEPFTDPDHSEPKRNGGTHTTPKGEAGHE